MDEHVALCKEILQLFKIFTEKTTDEATQYVIPLLVQFFYRSLTTANKS